MTIDWPTHLDTVYAVLGVAAVLTPANTDPPVDLVVIDKTAGIDVDIGGSVAMPTIKPACAVRVADLTGHGISLDEIKGSLIAFNAASWLVEGKMFRPSPLGEMEGEVYLLLIEDRDG